LPTLPQKESALKGFISRFDNPGNLKPAPALDPALAADPQERSHVLLVNRAALVDYHFDLLASSQQAAICRLVRGMGEGMIWASRVFKKQNGILQTPAQLSRYCWHVLGTPILFADEMQRLDQGLSPQIGGARLRQCAVVGEVIQLANITRDLEKDVRRGIFYHPQLPGTQSARREECIREVRAQLVLRALRGFRQFPQFFNAIPAAPISRARGAAMLLIITTFSYYWRAAQKAGLPAFDKQQRITRLSGAFIWLKCVLSPRASARFMKWLEKTVVIAVERCQPDRSKRFIWEDGAFDVVALLK
jgi:phytoene/squalene synthetase